MIEFDKFEFIIVANSCVIIIQVNKLRHLLYKQNARAISLEQASLAQWDKLMCFPNKLEQSF